VPGTGRCRPFLNAVRTSEKQINEDARADNNQKTPDAGSIRIAAVPAFISAVNVHHSPAVITAGHMADHRRIVNVNLNDLPGILLLLRRRI
jgi:hypothetical protein